MSSMDNNCVSSTEGENASVAEDHFKMLFVLKNPLVKM